MEMIKTFDLMVMTLGYLGAIIMFLIGLYALFHDFLKGYIIEPGYIFAWVILWGGFLAIGIATTTDSGIKRWNLLVTEIRQILDLDEERYACILSCQEKYGKLEIKLATGHTVHLTVHLPKKTEVIHKNMAPDFGWRQENAGKKQNTLNLLVWPKHAFNKVRKTRIEKITFL